MTQDNLQEFLHTNLPISKAMQVSVVEISDESVTLSAPLAPNINHCGTVFGGSASTLAILAAWSLLHTRLQSTGVNYQLVIQRNTMNYEHPISGTFTARSALTNPADLNKFLNILSRRGKARISISSELAYDNKIVGRFTGQFVALRVNNI